MRVLGTIRAPCDLMKCGVLVATLDGLAERLGQSSQVLQAEALEVPSLQVSSLNWTGTSCGLKDQDSE